MTQTDRTGVLLINLGTPSGTDFWSVRRYLSEFLSDRRMIELPPLLWQPLLQGVILTVRPGRSAKAYAKVWNAESNESPQLHYTRRLAEKLAEVYEDEDGLRIDWAMRYGKPSIESRLDGLLKAGCSKILLFALYPQYSATTTATAYDHAFRTLMTLRVQPAVRTMPAYFDRPVYLEAVAKSINTHLKAMPHKPERLLLSFHGLPKSYCEKGDPYDTHCARTFELLKPLLEIAPDQVLMTFQSRFGPQEWLQPYTDDVLRSLAEDGVRHVAVATPGFACDCLETLEEIAIGSREAFEEAGGSSFAFIPCLNDSMGAVDMMQALIGTELQGWT